MQAQVPVSTTRRWKADAKAEGDDWDKVKTAHTMASGSLDEIGREILTGFLLQYRTVMEQLNDSESKLGAEDKVNLLASLADAYNKTIAANKKILPETSELATAMQVVDLLSTYIQKKAPDSFEVFVDLLLNGFDKELAKKFG